jgi:HPr kinase/phosphorylase
MAAQAKDNRQSPTTVASFLEAAKDELGLKLVSGADGLDRRILEGTMNRPGLALSGFMSHFAYKRIQVLGLAESDYIRSLKPELRGKRLRDFLEQKIPCMVVTRGKKPLPDLRKLSDELKIPLLWTDMVTKHFINAATIIMENLMAPRLQVLGTLVEIMGIGVLIQGKPGTGKSEAALSLIRRGYALVSDDVTALRVDSSGSVIGSSVPLTRYHIEIRGLGIIHVPSLFGVASVREEKRLDLVISLCSLETYEGDRSGLTKTFVDILGATVPKVFLPVTPGKDIANVIETAALNQKLMHLGHDAAKELDAKLMALMNKGSKVASE